MAPNVEQDAPFWWGGVQAVIAGNAGTPLLWALVIYLLFGIPLMASLEAWIMARRSEEPFARLRKGAFLANVLCFAAGVGLAWAGPHLTPLIWQDRPLERVTLAIFAMTGLWWICCCLLRWPTLVWSSYRGRVWHGLATSVGLSSLVCVLIGAAFAAASSISLLTSTQTMGRASLPPEALGWVYAIQGDQVVRIRTSGGEVRYVGEFPVELPPDAYLATERDEEDQIVLFALSREEPVEGARLTLELPDEVRLSDWRAFFPGADPIPADRGLHAGRTFREGPPSNYTLFDTRWPWMGLRVGARSSVVRSYALETPFVYWGWRSYTALPGGYAVAQVGPQIVTMDLEGSAIVRLANATGPVVVLDAYEED